MLQYAVRLQAPLCLRLLFDQGAKVSFSQSIVGDRHEVSVAYRDRYSTILFEAARKWWEIGEVRDDVLGVRVNRGQRHHEEPAWFVLEALSEEGGKVPNRYPYPYP